MAKRTTAATTKTAGPKEPTPEAATKKIDDAKTQVERMFGGTKQPPELHIDTSIPMSEYADPDADVKSAKAALDAVDAILNALGTDKFEATVVPFPKNRNNGGAAAAFVLWDHVSKFAVKKAKEAEALAFQQGVFGEPDDYTPGETSLVYQTPWYTVSVKKGHDTKMVNKDNVVDVLREVGGNKQAEYLERCMKPRAGPVQKIISLK